MSGDPEDFDGDDLPYDDDRPVGPATQVGLVCAVFAYLAKTDDGRTPNARQQNAVINAANDIMAQLRWLHRPTVAGMGFDAWWQCDDTGSSSKYLAAILSGERFAVSKVNYPHDPQDFGRCVRMLDACPGFRELLPVAMADPAHGPAWNALAARWAELEALYAAALPSGDGSKLYAEMKACGC